jgi:hypothetical protein
VAGGRLLNAQGVPPRLPRERAAGAEDVQRVEAGRQPRGVGVVDGVVAGEGVPVRAVLDRVLAHEPAEIGRVPAGALQLQTREGVDDAAVMGEGRVQRGSRRLAIGAL